MTGRAGGRLVADVRVSEASDAIFVTPRDGKEGGRVHTELLRLFGPEAGLRRTAHGIRVPSACLARLTDTDCLELRWNDEAHRFLANRDYVARHFDEQWRRLKELKTRGELARDAIADSSGLGTLDPHQIVNVAAMTAAGGFGLCVFDEQGAGKTVTAIYAFDLLVARDEADLMLIVAPKSMVPEWASDFARFRGDLYRVALVTGSAREKRAALRSGSDVFVTNFETAVSLEPELRTLLRGRGRRAILTVDESFFVKSLDAQRTRALMRLREWCGRAFVLCGTPAPNSAHDLVQQFNLVDMGHAFNGVDVPSDRHAAVAVVQQAIESGGLYIRHLKSDVLPGLPIKRFQRVYVPLQPVQGRAYKKALTTLIRDAESVSDVEFRRQIANFLARRAALLQLCSAPSAVLHDYRETPAKLLALDSILAELVEKRNEKVVVWSFFTASVDAIASRYRRYKALRYDGTVPDAKFRREVVRSFQEDDEAMVLVANPAAAGAGLTLHRARYAVYESLSNQAAHYLQSLDRIHRRGQTRTVEYIVLLGYRTIELQEYDRLLSKQANAGRLLHDASELASNRETFLAEARSAAKLLEAL